MRAAVYDGNSLIVRDWAEPAPGAGEVLVAPTRVGISGSDTRIVLEGSVETSTIPVILGHEPAGRVVGVGDGVPRSLTGRRVVVVPIVTCGDCRFCRGGRSVLCSVREVLGIDRHGAFADLIVVPERNVQVIPDGVGDEIAALCSNALGGAHHAVIARGGVTSASRVAIWGAGAMGLAVAAVCRGAEAATISVVEPREIARERATAAGASQVLAPEEALYALRGQIDVAFECVGSHDSARDAVRVLDRGGRAVIIGIGHDRILAGALTAFATHEREVVGSMGSEPEEVAEVLQMLGEGRLSVPGLIGSEVELENVMDGLRRVSDGDAEGSRVILRIQD